MTVSFHQYGEDFFPGTGGLDEVGSLEGKYHSINVPLKRGMDDNSYLELFKNVITKVIDVYRPNAIVFQSGADSLSGD
jgi:histone deacetylase 1/2